MAVKEHDDQHYSNQGMRERLLRQRRNRLKPKLRRSKNTVTVRGQRSGKKWPSSSGCSATWPPLLEEAPWQLSAVGDLAHGTEGCSRHRPTVLQWDNGTSCFHLWFTGCWKRCGYTQTLHLQREVCGTGEPLLPQRGCVLAAALPGVVVGDWRLHKSCACVFMWGESL